MLKTKKFIVSLGLATVLLVGGWITASASAFSAWRAYGISSYGSTYWYGFA